MEISQLDLRTSIPDTQSTGEHSPRSSHVSDSMASMGSSENVSRLSLPSVEELAASTDAILAELGDVDNMDFGVISISGSDFTDSYRDGVLVTRDDLNDSTVLDDLDGSIVLVSTASNGSSTNAPIPNNSASGTANIQTDQRTGNTSQPGTSGLPASTVNRGVQGSEPSVPPRKEPGSDEKEEDSAPPAFSGRHQPSNASIAPCGGSNSAIPPQKKKKNDPSRVDPTSTGSGLASVNFPVFSTGSVPKEFDNVLKKVGRPDYSSHDGVVVKGEWCRRFNYERTPHSVESIESSELFKIEDLDRPFGRSKLSSDAMERRTNTYYPIYSFRAGWHALKMGALMFWQRSYRNSNAITRQVNERVQAGGGKSLPIVLRTEEIRRINLSIFQRISVGVMGISLMFRGALSLLQLGWLFYPLDALVDWAASKNP